MLILLRRRGSEALVLSGVFPVHKCSIPCPLPTFPEAGAPTTDDASSAERAGIDSIALLARAPSTDHHVRPLVDVVLGCVMALVTWMHAIAAAEAEPAVGMRVVLAVTRVREGSIGGKFCVGFGFTNAEWERSGSCLRGDLQKFDAGDM